MFGECGNGPIRRGVYYPGNGPLCTGGLFLFPRAGYYLMPRGEGHHLAVSPVITAVHAIQVTVVNAGFCY